MKKLAKILAVVLTLALMLTGITLVASAASETLEAFDAEGNSVGKYTDLQAAIDAVGAKGTVKLLANHTVTNPVTIDPITVTEPDAEPVTVVPEITIELNNGKVLYLNVAANISVSGGAKLTIQNGHFQGAGSNTSGDLTTFAVYTEGENTTTNFNNVKVSLDRPLFHTTNGATLNIDGSFGNAQWMARRRNHYILDATVNLKNVDINGQYNEPIQIANGVGSTINMTNVKLVTANRFSLIGNGAHVINADGCYLSTADNGSGTYQYIFNNIGYDDRINVVNSTLFARANVIQMTSGAAWTPDNALDAGEYHIKIVNSTVESVVDGYDIIKYSPYLTAVKDSTWLYWSTDGKTGYHWEEVKLPEGTTEEEWLAAANNVKVTQDNRSSNANRTFDLKERKVEDGKYFELVPELPYRHTEMYFENSRFITNTNPVINGSFVTSYMDNGTTVIRNQDYYQSERHSMLNVEFNGCLVETNSHGYYAYSSTTKLTNTVTVFSGLKATPGCGVLSNGRFEAYNSAFLYPTQEATGTNKYHLMFNSGNGRNNFWLENVYFSDLTNSGGVHGYSNNIDMYGVSGMVVHVKGNGKTKPVIADIQATIDQINKEFETSYKLPKLSPTSGFAQDFDAVRGFGGDMNWVVPGVKVEGAAAALENGAMTLTAGEGANALYFGHYNTNYNIAVIQNSSGKTDRQDQYKGNYFEYLCAELKITSKTTPFDDLAVIGVYAVDFTITSTAPTTVNLVAEDGSVAGTVNLPALAGADVTLVTKIGEDGKNITKVYIDGKFHSDANMIDEATTVLLGVKLSFTEGTVTLDNLSINHYNKSYTDADALFSAFSPDLSAWRTELAPEEPTPEEPTEVTVRWYLDVEKTVYVEKTFMSDEAIVFPEELLPEGQVAPAIGTVIEKYVDFSGNDAETPYVINANGKIIYKNNSTHPDFIDTAYDFVRTKLTWVAVDGADCTYAPEYVGDLGAITAPDGTVTYYGSYREFRNTVAGIAKAGYKVTLLSDLITPTEAAITNVFMIYADMEFDLNGKKLYCIGNNQGSTTAQDKLTVFYVDKNGVTADVYSSKEGAEIVTQGQCFLVGYNKDNVTLNISSFGDEDNTQRGYGITVHSSVFYSSQARHVNDTLGDNFLNVCGAYINRVGDFRAVFITGTSYDHQIRVKDSVIVGENSLILSGTDGIPVDAGQGIYNDMTFDNCVIHMTQMFNFANLLNLTFNNCTFTADTKVNLINNAGKIQVYTDKETTFKQANGYFKWEFKYSAVVAEEGANTGTVTITYPSGKTATLVATFADDKWTVPAGVANEEVYVTFNHCTAQKLTNQMTNFYDKLEFDGALKEFVFSDYRYKNGASVVLPFKKNDGTLVSGNKVVYLTTAQLSINYSSSRYFDWSNVAASEREFANVTWTDGTTTITQKLPVGSVASAPASFVNGLAANQALTNNNFVVTRDVTVTVQYVPTFGIYQNLTLTDNFTYNIYLPYDAVNTDGTVITVDGDVVDLATLKTTTLPDGTKCYVITVELDPTEIGVAVALNLVGGPEGQVYDVTKQLSILDYVTMVINSDKEVNSNLGKAIVAYAKACCDQFVTDVNTVAGYGELCALVEANPIDFAAVEGTANLDMSAIKAYVTGAALKLDGAPKFRFYLKDANVDAKFTYTYGGEEVSVETTTAGVVLTDGNRYYVELELRAYEFAQDITIEAGGVTVVYNLVTYVARHSYNTNITNLMRALSTYSVAAKAYKDSQ